MKPEDEDLINEENEIPEIEDNENFDDDDDSLDNFGFDDMGMEGGLSPMDKHSDLLKGLTNFDPYLKEIVSGWLGKVWDNDKETYVRDQNIDPIMNEKCAAWCVTFLKTFTRGNNIITNISEIQYVYMISDIIKTVWLNLGSKCIEFGITKNKGDPDNGNILRVCVELQSAAELVLMGAGDGKYNQFLSTVTQRNETVNPINNLPYNQPNQTMQNPMGQLQNIQVPGMFKKMKDFALGK